MNKKKSSRLRAQVELLSKQQSGEGPGDAGRELTRRGSGLEEDCQMEVEKETDCKKKLDEEVYRHGSGFPGQAERKVDGRVARD